MNFEILKVSLPDEPIQVGGTEVQMHFAVRIGAVELHSCRLEMRPGSGRRVAWPNRQVKVDPKMQSEIKRVMCALYLAAIGT
ncbi:hypothetical protein SAMN05421853_1108 [Roseivivax halotolerans]|uniref:Uncharacterized protein n=1 Tax=Roseivivax halotolerans TaxID=93684 RepID=A0A1I5ZHM6_9RHOB|nr:hypothetical protein [Roseivivax halotolerans]SFQ55637.1 hypothetical protein SAMN05421853_1108 [Roseivivax halotolerans]